MTKRIPITRAKEIAKRHGLDQVILVAWDGKGGRTHVVTYGTSLRDCEQAAAGGNRVKRALGWPASFDAEPSRVTALRSEAKALRDALLVVSTDLAQDRLEDPVGNAEREAAGFFRIGRGARDAVRAALGREEPTS